MGKFWYVDGNGKRKRTKAGYAHQKEKFESSPKDRADRSARVSARKKAIREGRVHRNDGLEIDHKDSNPQHNSRNNLRVVSRKTNRAKRENSRRRGSRRNTSRWGR